MELDNNGMICVLLLLTIFTQFILRSALWHIHDLGRSRTYRKKNRRKFSLREKTFLIGYVEECKYYRDQAKKLRIACLADFIYSIISILFWILSSFIPLAGFVLRGLVFVKVILFGIPVFIFFFIMTEHGKNGGVTWRWEAPH